ncbi:MAG TPA: ATPase [Anaerolineae bacterium]|nr:ATPase [Anaerolineae bacterium]
MFVVFAVLVGLIPVIPAVIYVIQNGKTNPSMSLSRLVTGFNTFNFLVGMMAAGLAVVWFASPSSVLASGAAQEGGSIDQYASLAAALSTGLACIGAGIAVGGSAAAAVGATAEKPESFGRALIFVGLSEGIAIYGLIISFLVLP